MDRTAKTISRRTRHTLLAASLIILPLAYIGVAAFTAPQASWSQHLLYGVTYLLLVSCIYYPYRQNAQQRTQAATAKQREPLRSPSADVLHKPLQDLHDMTVRLSEHATASSTERREQYLAVAAMAESLEAMFAPPQGSSSSELTQVEVDLGDMVEKAAWAFAEYAAANRHELYCYVAPDLPEALFGDRDKLRHLLRLLLLSACYVKRDGEIRLQVTCDSQKEEPIRIGIYIFASGISNPASKALIESCGLHRLAYQLGGVLEVNVTGETVAWRVSLPLDGAPGTAHSAPEQALNGFRIAIIGDTPLSDILRSYLQAQGADLQRDADDADILLLAVSPREVEAYCQRLRREHPEKRLLCQGATANQLPGVLLEADAILPMPLTRVELLRRILSVTDQHTMRPDSAPLTIKEPARRGPTKTYSANVLLAEDDAISARLVVHFLEQAGCLVNHVLDGQTALQALTAGGIQLALLDMQMPGLSGTEVARQFRQWETAKGKARLPLVALTANASEQDRSACEAAGMDGFLTKPLTGEALFELLDQQLAAKACPAEENNIL